MIPIRIQQMVKVIAISFTRLTNLPYLLNNGHKSVKTAKKYRWKLREPSFPSAVATKAHCFCRTRNIRLDIFNNDIDDQY